MKKFIVSLVAGSLLLTNSVLAKEIVTAENFIRAETDVQFTTYSKYGGFSKFFHLRQPTNINKQRTIRMNRDTLYSFAVIDLNASPVTVNLPKLERFQSLQIINQDHYTWTEYGTGNHTFTREQVGSRYVGLLIRTFVDADSPQDIKIANEIQNQVTVSQNDVGTLELPQWDNESLTAVRTPILALAKTLENATECFGMKNEVKPVKHYLCTALGWGGNPTVDAMYDNVFPEKNDGKTAYTVTIAKDEVPVDAFWSVTVYNKTGFMEKNKYNTYALNDKTAEKNADGSITINFGGDDKAKNFIPTFNGWNYIVRLYKPQDTLINGTYKFPKPTEIK
ncbi:MAG: DUF1214 domain-containing protein [Colwellia sp.]